MCKGKGQQMILTSGKKHSFVKKRKATGKYPGYFNVKMNDNFKKSEVYQFR